MKNKLSNKDYIWSYIGVFLALTSNVLMTPFIIYVLDANSFGIWEIFTSLGAITTLFDFGFSTTFARNINYCWNGAKELKKEGVVYSESNMPNFYNMKKTMISCKIVFFIISIVAFAVMLTAGTAYIYHVAYGMLGKTAIIAWLFYAGAIFLNLYFGYYGSFLRGIGAVYEANVATVVSKLLQMLLTFVLLKWGFGIIGTGIAYLIYGTTYRQMAKHLFYNYNNIRNGLNEVKSKIPLNEIKDMFFIVWHNAWREGLVSFANYCTSEACTIICSLYLSLSQTGVYSLAVQLAVAIAQISAVTYSVNQPALQASYIANNQEKIRRTMSLVVFSFCVLNILGLVGVTVLGLPILKIIKPEMQINVPLMLGVGVYQFMLKFRNCYTSYFSCTNRIPYVKAFVFSSMLCVMLSVLTMKTLNLGIWGIVGAQIISQGIYNFWNWPYRAHKELKLSPKILIVYGYEESLKVIRSLLKK